MRLSHSVQANAGCLRGGSALLVVQQDGDVARDAAGRSRMGLRAGCSRDACCGSVLSVRPRVHLPVSWLHCCCDRVPLVHELEPGSAREAVIATAFLEGVLPPLELLLLELVVHDCVDELLHFLLQCAVWTVVLRLARVTFHGVAETLAGSPRPGLMLGLRGAGPVLASRRCRRAASGPSALGVSGRWLRWLA